ncbi:MAG: efflux RND transporter periplasmic adaptor subunit, partial [Phenylobacterium sp.]|nr:efflux RND transporter periplasmic adaptor subunit [Phenylobacterium sp.]
MRIQGRRLTVLVAVGLILVAAGSAVAFWRLQPAPAPAQVIYGSGRIEVDEVRVSFELSGRLLQNHALEGAPVRAGAPLASIDPSDARLLMNRAAAQRAAAGQTVALV